MTRGGAIDVDRAVFFQGDGERQSPRVTIGRLAEYETKRGIAPDSYSLGGTVEELERVMAEALGKEAALFLPTGTLAPDRPGPTAAEVAAALDRVATDRVRSEAGRVVGRTRCR